MARSVVFLAGPDHQPAQGKGASSLVHIGTGFLVAVPNGVCLVTAQHVSDLLREGASLTVAGTDDAPITFKLVALAGGKPPRWSTHPTADVAAVVLSPPAEALAQLSARALPSQLLVSNLEAPTRGRPLTVIGFPLGLGVLIRGPEDRLSPITRESKVVSGLLTLGRFDNHVANTFFLLDSPSIGGFSGSPVFATMAPYSEGAVWGFPGRVLLFGLIHGTVKDAAEGRLTAVVPSANITSTIDRAYQAFEASQFHPLR